MSFRNRLALFFLLIVIVPMLAVAVLVFRLIDTSVSGQADAKIAARHDLARSLFGELKDQSAIALREVVEDRVFTSAVQQEDLARAQKRAGQLLGRAIERIIFIRDGKVVVDAGDRRAIAPAVRDTMSAQRRPVGRAEVAVGDAVAYGRRIRALTGLHVVVLNGGVTLATTLPEAEPELLPASGRADVSLAGTDYRAQAFVDGEPFSGQRIRVVTLGSIAAAKADVAVAPRREFAAAVLLGFLLVAIACAWIVSRTLQQQIAALLSAARRLAGGDFGAKVPTTGRDEFAALGEEFNKMSGELERRLAELSQERGRVQDSMRRLGEAVASNLDRDALLELVVRTAVDGVGADAGRALVRRDGHDALEERSRVGDMNGLQDAVAAVEAVVLRSGRRHETTVGEANAIANPLHAADDPGAIIGVVSLGRAGRPFTSSDRDLFDFLAAQAARSMKNVELHETAARESVTDELTGLCNRRKFDESLAKEIERARRFGTHVGLVLIDLDDFKRVNDTYGHPQGDVVLREVGRVLRESSREIDHPARYGGEELAVILPGTDLDGALVRAERVREEIARLRLPRLDGGGALTITASCGVAAVRGQQADARTLVEAADGALYAAKRGGKNASVPAR